jgi:hypothetical protein
VGFSPLTIHHSPLIIYLLSSPLTIHHSPLIIFFPPLLSPSSTATYSKNRIPKTGPSISNIPAIACASGE